MTLPIEEEMTDLKKEKHIRLVICFAWFVGFVVLLFYVTADDDHDDDIDDNNTTTKGNITTHLIEDLEAELSGRYFVIFLSLSLSLAVLGCLSVCCWSNAKERVGNIDIVTEGINKKIRKLEEAVAEMKTNLENAAKDSQDKRKHYSPSLPEDDDLLDHPMMVLPSHPARYSSPPSSLIQYPPLTQVCTSQEARIIASMEK